MISQEDIQAIKQYLIEQMSPDVIYIFGSAVKGTMRKDSDIDIAFLSDHPYNTYDIFIMAQKLADILGREIDLIDLNQASTVFQAQIINNGKVIYSRDEKKRMIFEMITYKKYTRLNEERKPIFEKIKESGSIYAE